LELVSLLAVFFGPTRKRTKWPFPGCNFQRPTFSVERDEPLLGRDRQLWQHSSLFYEQKVCAIYLPGFVHLMRLRRGETVPALLSHRLASLLASL
jgi:hypothetical protein